MSDLVNFYQDCSGRFRASSPVVLNFLMRNCSIECLLLAKVNPFEVCEIFQASQNVAELCVAEPFLVEIGVLFWIVGIARNTGVLSLVFLLNILAMSPTFLPCT